MADVLQRGTSFCGALIVLMLVAGMSPATAQAGHWVGDWRQLESSAGQCPSCRITISGIGRVLTVVASNGWTAEVTADVENGLAAAHGEGRWNEMRASRLAGLPFAIHLTERGNLLHMTMQIMRAGRTWTVRAVFGRA
ncbi:MAG: hypothetical protein WBF99_00440 [Xanthobacteraceae bacterium]